MQIAQSKINTLKAQTQIAQAKKIYEKHKHKLRKQKKSQVKRNSNFAICEICALVCAYPSSARSKAPCTMTSTYLTSFKENFGDESSRLWRGE